MTTLDRGSRGPFISDTAVFLICSTAVVIALVALLGYRPELASKIFSALAVLVVLAVVGGLRIRIR